MSSRGVRDLQKTEKERESFRAQLATAINEEDDPLAVYNQFVQWTIKTYGENDPKSGLLELLEEATREFKGDPVYKTDLRYLKLWSLYARQVERPGAIAIYAYLVSNDIGTSYSILYEEYASLLEIDGRRSEAEAIYREGIKRQVRPLERLKNRYREFQSRSATSSALPALPNPPLASSSESSPSDVLRQNPLRKHVSQTRSALTSTSSASTKGSSSNIAVNSTAESRYVHMLAPPAPGKRPEKLRFEWSLLFTKDGVEYSIQEARARSMGLLGKKWGPLPPPETFRSFSMPVDFNDDGDKMTMGRRKSLMGGAEPTVTINTKEALADVFGMYNSPDKTLKLTALTKVKPNTPATLPRLALIQENENAVQNAKTPTPAFRPFADENSQPSRITPGPAKFTPFVDPDPHRTPFMTPRPVLSVKDSTSTPSSNFQPSENASRGTINVLKLQAAPGPEDAKNVFSSKVFTPAQTKPLPLDPLRDVFTDDHGKPQPKAKPTHTHERAKSHHDALPPTHGDGVRGATFTPFIDENAKTPFKVFSRPPEQTENTDAYTPKYPRTVSTSSKPSFTPFRDDHVAFTPFVDDEPKPTPKPLSERPALSWSNTVVEIEDSTEEEQDSNQYQDDYQYDDVPGQRYDMPPSAHEAEIQYEEGESFQEVPLGGRFGRFNVMTPITERTFEFTTSTRGGSTPNERLHYIDENGDPTYENVFIPQQRDEHGAIIAAKQLAAELKEEANEDHYEEGHLEPLRLSTSLVPREEDPVLTLVEEKTGMLSLGDTLSLNSKFRPKNPCNPFDASLISTLLSRIPTDPHYYDLVGQQANQLEDLQKFARKARKTSGSSNNAGVLDAPCFQLTLAGHKFSVSEKLGEGGFGAVFKARDAGAQRDEEDSDEDLDADLDDEDGVSLVALKVVKPRNLWEYHVLRRLHSVLPAQLRRSVILPHALYAFRDESFLVLDLCPQGTLLNIVNGAVAAGVSQQGGCLDELLVMFFSIELLRLLEAMHDAGFIHGDLKIDNCLLRLEDVPGSASAWSSVYQPSGEGGWSYKGLKVIDFGRTIDTRLFPPGQQYIAEWPTDERDCFEVREDKPWTYETDYFGLAGIIYCMLFGKYIQESSVGSTSKDEGLLRHKITTPLKRYWQTDLWNKLFDVLLNPKSVRPEGQLPVSEELGSLREEMETWLQAQCNRTSNTLKGLLKKVELSCFIR